MEYKKIPEKEKEAMVRMRLSGETIKSIAEKMEKSENTVRRITYPRCSKVTFGAKKRSKRIFEKYVSGMSMRDLARDLGIRVSRVYRILLTHSYRYRKTPKQMKDEMILHMLLSGEDVFSVSKKTGYGVSRLKKMVLEHEREGK